MRFLLLSLFDQCRDLPAFKNHIRDFLVQLKTFSGAADIDDLCVSPVCSRSCSCVCIDRIGWICSGRTIGWSQFNLLSRLGWIGVGLDWSGLVGSLVLTRTCHLRQSGTARREKRPQPQQRRLTHKHVRRCPASSVSLTTNLGSRTTRLELMNVSPNFCYVGVSSFCV